MTPIIADSVEYSVPENYMTYIVARNIKTDSIIWKKKIYEIPYEQHLEKDVQDIFIDSIKIKKRNLLIRTERGKYYSLNLQSLCVTDIKQDDF